MLNESLKESAAAGVAKLAGGLGRPWPLSAARLQHSTGVSILAVTMLPIDSRQTMSETSMASPLSCAEHTVCVLLPGFVCNLNQHMSGPYIHKERCNVETCDTTLTIQLQEDPPGSRGFHTSQQLLPPLSMQVRKTPGSCCRQQPWPATSVHPVQCHCWLPQTDAHAPRCQLTYGSADCPYCVGALGKALPHALMCTSRHPRAPAVISPPPLPHVLPKAAARCANNTLGPSQRRHGDSWCRRQLQIAALQPCNCHNFIAAPAAASYCCCSLLPLPKVDWIQSNGCKGIGGGRRGGQGAGRAVDLGC